MAHLELIPVAQDGIFMFTVENVDFHRAETFKGAFQILEADFEADKPFRICFGTDHVSCTAHVTAEQAELMLSAGAVLSMQRYDVDYRPPIDCLLGPSGFRCVLDKVSFYSNKGIPDSSVLSLRSTDGSPRFLVVFRGGELTTCTFELTQEEADKLQACGVQLATESK